MSGILTATVLYCFRLLPLFVIVPVGFFNYVPVLVRMVVALVFAVVSASVLSTYQLEGLAITPVALVAEFFLGVLLAFGFHAVYSAVHFFAQLIDLQVGFIAGAVFDPANQQIASPTAKLFGLILAFLFAMSDFHLYLMAAFLELGKVLPAGSLYELQSGWYSVVGMIFSFAFAAIIPVVIAIWLIDIVTAIVSRSLPQAQVYFVGLPLKVWLGLLLLALLMKNLSLPMVELLKFSVNSWDKLVKI